MSRLQSSIVDLLEGLIRRNRWTRLPSQRQLAAELRVSRATMAAAIATLRRRGVLCTFGRAGTWVAGSEPATTTTISSPGSSSFARLLTEVRECIVDGRLSAGGALPKLEFYAIDRHISARTVRRVYDQLSTEGLAFRRGKQWIVGSPPVTRSATRERPVILIVMPREDIWRQMSLRAETAPFALRFSQECERCGIETFPVLMEPSVPDHLSGILPAGLSGGRSFIDSLGKRYLGALVLDEHPGREPGRGWMRLLAERDRPAVFVDPARINSAGFSSRHHPRTILTAGVDEESAARNALMRLRQAGHRHCGAVRQLSIQPQIEARLQRIEQAARECGMQLHVYTESSRFWEDRPDGQTPAQVIRRLRRHGIPVVRTILEAVTGRRGFWKNPELYKRVPDLYSSPLLSPFDMQVVWGTHLLTPLFRQLPITALIALDDSAAVSYFYWLKAVGARIPQDVSLISFGNQPTLSPLPISAVDFGLDHLGYLSFHAILGDLPVRGRSDGRLLSRVTIIERGSIDHSRGLRSQAGLVGEIW